MPHKKNLVNKWTPLYSKDSSVREFEDDLSTDPKLQFEFLSDIFPKVDKEIIQDVLLECGDSLNEAIEKLQEISEGHSCKPAVKEADNDLAVIACSLLADESQPIGASKMDIYEDSEEQYDVLTSPDAGSSRKFSNNKELFSTGMDFPRSSFNVNNAPFDVSVGKYSELLTNGVGSCVNMYASNGEINHVLLFNETKDTKFDDVNNVNIRKVKSNNFEGSNKLWQKVLANERNVSYESYNSFQALQNGVAPSTTVNNQSYAPLSVDCVSDKDRNVFASWRNNSLKEVNSVISDTKVQEVVVNGEQDLQKKADVKGLPDEVLAAYVKWPHLLSEPPVNSVSKTGNKISEFYNNFEKSSFNIHSEYPGAIETVSYMTQLPRWTETQSAAFELHHSTANREKNSSSGQPTNKKSDVQQEFSQKHSTKPSSQVNDIFSPQKSKTTLFSASDTPHNSHQKASTSNDCSYSSANGDVPDGTKKTIMKSRLSASALEFVPRPLASSKPVVQTSAALEAQKAVNPESSQPPSSSPTKSPGRKKGSKAKKNKQNGKAETPAPESGNNVKLSLESSSSTDMGTGSDAKATARSQKSIDPTDPLGWGDVFSHLTHSLVDPKPQRQKKNRKTSSCKSDEKVTLPHPPSAPWNVNHTQPSAESDESELFFSEAQDTSNALPVKDPLTSSGEPYVFPAKSSSSSSGISGCSYINEKPEHGNYVNKINSESETSNMFASTGRDLSPVSNRLPPSLLGRNTPTAITADQFQGEVSNFTSPKNGVLGMGPALGSPSAPSLAHVFKNKLQFRGIKTPSGVIRRYILEKRPVMIILRGLPGSGKSYLARQLLGESLKMGVQGAVLSTDDYFMHSGQYCFNKSDLSDAHIWNKKRAQQLMKESVSPVIIDNTNSTMWELLPYAILALEHNYDVQLFEPDTAWKLKVMELTRKNSHGVAKESIKRMKDRWEKFTLDDILKRANQSMALRKNPSAVPVEAAQTPSKDSAKSAAISKHNPASDHKVPSTKVKTQKTSNVSYISPDEDLGLSDWSGPPINQKVKKVTRMQKSSNNCPKAKITLDFLNNSLKKAMVNPSGVSSQVDVSNNGNDFTQAFGYTKRNFASDAKIDDPVLERQLSGDSWSSDIKTPTADKLIVSEESFQMFSHIQAGKDNIQEDDVTNSIGNCGMSADKQANDSEKNCGESSYNKVSVTNCGALSYNMVNGDVEDSDLLSDLPEELLKPGDVNEDSALNSTCSTSNSFHTCYSSSSVSLVDYENAHDGSVLSAKISCDDCTDGDDDAVCNHGADKMFDAGVQEMVRVADDFNAIDDFNVMLNETVRESDKTTVHGHSVFTLEDERHSEDLSHASQQAHPVAQHASSPKMSSFTDYWETETPPSLLSSEAADFDGIINSFEAVSPEVSDSIENSMLEEYHSSSIHSSALVDYSESDDSEKELQGLQMRGECIQPYNNVEFVASSNNSVGRIPDASDDKLDSPSENMSMDFIDDVQIFHDGERIFTREISIDRSTQSSEDSMACSWEPGSQADPSIDPEGLKKKQKKKRVRKGRNQVPFIEDFLKMKSKTENWSSFVKQVTETCDSSGDSVITEPESPRVEAVSASSQTDQYYFSIVHKLNSPAFNHSQPVDWSLSEIEIMTSSRQVDIHERWTSVADNANAAASRRSSNFTDQSTVTDEMLEKEEIDLETLQNCFPEYSRKQLEATMAICQNDLEWVTSHLLDSPALFDMEEDDDDDDDEKSLKNNMLKLNKGSVSYEASGRVKSLADLCTALVRKMNRVDTDDLEMQVIQIGQGRLQKIEMFGRSRLHSMSQEDLGDPDYWPDNFVLDEIPLARPASITQATDFNIMKPAFRQGPSAVLKSSTIIPGGPKQNNFLPSVMKNKPTLLSPSEEESLVNSSIFEVGNSSFRPLVVPQEPSMAVPQNDAAVHRNQAVLPLEFVRQLESLFGPLNLQMDNGGLALSDSTARKIYNCLKLQTARNVIKNSNEQQLRNDEALARVLQDEENLKMSYTHSKTSIHGTPVPALERKGTVPGWTTQLPSWISQSPAGTFRGSVTESVSTSGESNAFRLHSVSETLRHLRGASRKPTKFQKSQRRMPGASKSVWYTVRRRGQVDSLASIMEEEMAREEQQKEQLRILQSTGDMEALATRIKRIELSHLFPSIGPDILEDIFISTGCSKEETIKTLQLSYNIQPAPMSQDKRDILEQVLSKSKEDLQHVEDEYEADIPSEGSEITYDALRKEARFCRQLALDCQQQAQRYQSDGMQGAALFYRQRAKKYKEDERKANAEAAQVLFEKGQERLRMENTLDLHFYHLDEAINAVNMAIEMKEDEYRKRPDKKNKYLNIVTGWGRNSKNGIPKLKPAIIHHLWSRCLQYEEKSPGMLKVYLGKKL